jgi:hypothetical protein
MLRPEGQQKITIEHFGQMWQTVLPRIGDPGPFSVSCRPQPDGVAALITFTGTKNPLSLLVRFTPSAEIAMLRVMTPGESPPW